MSIGFIHSGNADPSRLSRGCFLCFNEHKGLQALNANSLFPLKEDHSLLADVLGPPGVWESCLFVNLVVTGLLLAACTSAILTLHDP